MNGRLLRCSFTGSKLRFSQFPFLQSCLKLAIFTQELNNHSAFLCLRKLTHLQSTGKIRTFFPLLRPQPSPLGLNFWILHTHKTRLRSFVCVQNPKIQPKCLKEIFLTAILWLMSTILGYNSRILPLIGYVRLHF